MINIIQQPQLFTPSKNPVLFQFGTTYSNTLYFNIQMYQSPSNYLIITDKAYVTPINVTGSEYNISDVMRSLVHWEINTATSSLVKPLTQPLNSFYLNVSEYGVGPTSGLVEQLSSTASTDIKNVWNAKLRRNSFNRFSYHDFVANTGNTTSNISFLTDNPDWTRLNNESFEQLYFLKDSAHSIKYDYTFYNNNVQIGNSSSTITSTYSLNRLLVAPRDLPLFFTYSNYDSYRVRLISSDGTTTVSNPRTYKIDTVPCFLELKNIIWINQVGGIDSYQFVNPVETRNVERSNIQKNTYNYDSNLNYTDREDGILNPNIVDINLNLNSTYRMYTRPMSNDELYWLGGILESEQIFIEIEEDGKSLYPVSLVESSYEIQSSRYKKDSLIQPQFTFKITGDAVEQFFFLRNPIEIITPTTISNIFWEFTNTADSGVFNIKKNGTDLVYRTASGTGTATASIGDIITLFDSATSSGTASSQLYSDNNGTQYSISSSSLTYSQVGYTFSYLGSTTIRGTSSQILPPSNIFWEFTNTADSGVFNIKKNGVDLVYRTTTGTGSATTFIGDIITLFDSATSSGTASASLYSNNNGTQFSTTSTNASYSQVGYTFSTIGNITVRGTSSQMVTPYQNIIIDNNSTDVIIHNVVINAVGLTALTIDFPISASQYSVGINYQLGTHNMDIYYSYTGTIQSINFQAFCQNVEVGSPFSIIGASFSIVDGVITVGDGNCF